MEQRWIERRALGVQKASAELVSRVSPGGLEASSGSLGVSEHPLHTPSTLTEGLTPCEGCSSHPRCLHRHPVGAATQQAGPARHRAPLPKSHGSEHGATLLKHRGRCTQGRMNPRRWPAPESCSGATLRPRRFSHGPAAASPPAPATGATSGGYRGGVSRGKLRPVTREHKALEVPVPEPVPDQHGPSAVVLSLAKHPHGTSRSRALAAGRPDLSHPGSPVFRLWQGSPRVPAGRGHHAAPGFRRGMLPVAGKRGFLRHSPVADARDRSPPRRTGPLTAATRTATRSARSQRLSNRVKENGCKIKVPSARKLHPRAVTPAQGPR